uniref:Uncharacterized protein n=1 Tax=Anguilla anguilla TaxID=7936 RepID=A0A0E9TJT8_ANGAN
MFVVNYRRTNLLYFSKN